LDAFEVNAVDYLLKPYTRDRFARAIAKLQAPQNPYLEQIQRLAESLKEEKNPQYTGKIFVQTGSRLLAVDTPEIIWLEADKDYTWLVTADKRHLSTYGLGQLENKLDKSMFVRVHRSSIINLNHIRLIEKQISGYDIVMNNGDVVRVSRGYMEEIKNRLL
ncbi:MAG: LytTR family DNA-binding domain-containing protein, partial [Bacteroidota bacterium]